MDRRDFLKTLAAAGAMLTVKSNGVMDIMASNLPSEAGAQAGADSYADMAAIMNGEPAAMLRAALEQLGGIKRFVKKGDKVVLKPNIGWDRTPELAANTNPELIVEMIKQCQSAGAAEVKVFDHACDEWTRCYDHSGIEKAVKGAGGIMVPANEESYYQEIELPKGKALKKAKVHKAILESDVWFNMPILKNHGGARLTIAMKNHMGIVWDRRAFHSQGLQECIADITTLSKPAALHIVDAYRIMTDNGPQGRNANDVVLTKALFASTDIVAVDTAAAKFFNQFRQIPLETVSHIENGQKLGMGTMDIDKLNVKRIKL